MNLLAFQTLDGYAWKTKEWSQRRLQRLNTVVEMAPQAPKKKAFYQDRAVVRRRTEN